MCHVCTYPKPVYHLPRLDHCQLPLDPITQALMFKLSIDQYVTNTSTSALIDGKIECHAFATSLVPAFHLILTFHDSYYLYSYIANISYS